MGGGARGTTVSIRGEGLTLEQLVAVARDRNPVLLDDEGRRKLRAARAALESITLRGAQAIYGVNTGFGRLASQRISEADTLRLQANLVASHEAGVGPALPEEVVRGALLVRANTLTKGHSGVRPEVVDGLLALLNADVHPVVPRYGSLGASGDLAPLAHVASVLLGNGKAVVGGRIVGGAEALRAAGVAPLQLASKEGLALVNGTPFMTAVAGLAASDARHLLRAADVVGALTLTALGGSIEPFAEEIHAARGHAGQKASAANLRRLLPSLEASDRVQDAYSLRCIPQIHGAIRDAVAHAVGVLNIEMNSATDNPLVFPDHGMVLSGGNFHGEPVALAADYATLALAELGVLSERRTNRLLHPDLNAGLPPFLACRPGLESGLMLTQYTAAALVARSRLLAHPASTGSIPVSGDQEDHVSLGLHAALDLREVVNLAWSVLGVELLCAAEAMEHVQRSVPAAMAAVHRAARKRVPPLAGDEPPGERIEAMAELLRSGDVTAAVMPFAGELA